MSPLRRGDEVRLKWALGVVEAAIDLYKHKCRAYTDVITGERHEVHSSNNPDDTAYIIPPIYMDALRDAIEAKP